MSAQIQLSRRNESQEIEMTYGDEELRAVGVGTSVGHGEEEGAVVTELEVLIGETRAVDGDTTSAVVVGEVTTLDYVKRMNI